MLCSRRINPAEIEAILQQAEMEKTEVAARECAPVATGKDKKATANAGIRPSAIGGSLGAATVRQQ